MGIHNIDVNVSVRLDHAGDRPVKLYGIRELGFNERGGFVIDGYPCAKDGDKPRGGFMTSLPISPVAYRREHGPGSRFPVKSGYVDHIADGYLTIFDDWGMEHRIIGPPDILSVLVRDCETHELPNLKS